MKRMQPNLKLPVDLCSATGYRSAYIRPVAVRPLDHPERWPTPRGFLFVAPESVRLYQSRWSKP